MDSPFVPSPSVDSQPGQPRSGPASSTLRRRRPFVPRALSRLVSSAARLVPALGLALAPALGLALGCSGIRPAELAPLPPTEPPRLLFFALDSIPYRLLAEVTDPARGEEALFQGFSRPVPLISSFPSTSSVAFTGILEPFDLDRPPGYEARFFDRESNRIRGGGLISYYKIGFPWREFFTWHYDDPIRRAFATARPVKSSAREVLWVLDAFAHSREPRFFGYTALTDGTAHLAGPEGLVPALETLDDGLRRLRGQHPEQPFYTVIYSDHGIAGGEPLRNVRQEVKKTLEEEGYRLTRRLRQPRDAVMVPFGLVSSFEVYLAQGQGAGVARALARIEGVDLCVARRPGGEDSDGSGDGPAWEIFSADGSAVLERRGPAEALEWSYRPGEGDPLGYAPRIDELRRRGGDPEARWFSDSAWLAATWDQHFPDALHRISRTFDLVTNTASTVCSVAPGFMYGAWKTDVAARLSTGRLRWTHGALHKEASYGFLMTDLPGWEPPPAVRFDEALRPFADLTGEDLAAIRTRPSP